MGEKAITKVAKKMIIRKVLSCLVIIAILVSAVPVSVFAVNNSNNATGNTSNYSNETLLEKAFGENNSVEVMIPLFNNWTEDDNISGDCAPIPDANMPEIYLNDTQESVDSGNDTGATILTQVSNDTRKNVSALGCNVYVKIDDDTCVGYDVYVDGVYQLTEGEGGTPDGYCAFYVTAGTHTIEIRKDGCSASITKDFQCGVTYRWVSMPDYWCECGDQEDEWEVKFQGTVNSTEKPYPEADDFICEVRVDKIISDPDDCIEEGWTVDIVLQAWDSPCGSHEEVKKGDKIEVFGKRLPVFCWPPQISLCGRSSYYLKKIDSKTLSISVWTDKSEYKIGKTVTIYYQTNKKCTAKLTITKPDGGKVVYGPNEIPAGTRSKLPTAGYPTGKRTVVFEAWAGDEYKKATCYFDVVEDAKEIKFRGEVLVNRPIISFYSIDIKIDEILNDPTGKLRVGDVVTAWSHRDSPAQVEDPAVGDRVEVFGKYFGHDVRGGVESDYIDLETSKHYLKNLNSKIKFNGTALEYFELIGAWGWKVRVDKIISGPPELQGHTVSVALWSVDPDQYPPGYMDPNIELGDKVEIYGLYVGEDAVTLSGSEDYYIKRISAGVLPDIIFQETFDNLDNWYLVVYNSAGGSKNDPAPKLDTSMGNPPPSLDVNGDSWCGDGAYSKMTFDYTNGLTIEFDIYVASGYDWNWGWGGLSDHMPNLNNKRPDGAYVDPLRCDPSFVAYVSFTDDGNYNRRPPTLHFGIRAEDGKGDGYTYSSDATGFENKWHRYKITILPSGYVEFYMNESLIWTSTKKIDKTLSPMPLVFGSRDAYGPVRIDNVKVFSVPSTRGLRNVIYPEDGVWGINKNYTLEIYDVSGRDANNVSNLAPLDTDRYLNTTEVHLKDENGDGNLSGEEIFRELINAFLRAKDIADIHKNWAEFLAATYLMAQGASITIHTITESGIPAISGIPMVIIMPEPLFSYLSPYGANINGNYRIMGYSTLDKNIVAMACPVNTTITDQYGRIISDGGTNEIPDADMFITGETKIFYLPADLRYSVNINAYDSGTFNFTRVSPIGNDISITKFENIPVTSNTKASVEIGPGVTDYTMSVDYDGDGIIDEVRNSNVKETIKPTPTHPPKCKVQITSDPSLQDRPSIVYANGYYYVAYQSHENGYGIFIKKFDSQWNFKKKVEVVSGSAYYDSPSLVFTNNKLYVAYVSNEKGATANDYDVIVKEYDPNSLACLRGKKYLTTLQSRQDLPALYYKDGYFYLAYRSWERGSSYNGDICIKKFDSNWNQLKKVQVTSKGSLQARPSLAYANGYLYVAYYSMETGDRDI